MRAVVQRVTQAAVTVDGEVVGAIGRGLCILVGVGKDDADQDASALAAKLVALRVFDDGEGKMNLALGDVGGSLLLVSQFTLLGDVRKGSRPSFTDAMEPERARDLFETVCAGCRSLGATVATGRFRAHMNVTLSNDGPVTLILDTKRVT